MDTQQADGSLFLSAFDRAEFAERTAIVFQHERWTYANIAAEADRIAAGLQRLGVKERDRVGLHFKNCPQLLAALLACTWIGSIAVPIRRWQSAPVTIAWSNHLAVSYLLVEGSLVGKLAPHLGALTSCRAVISTADDAHDSGVMPWRFLVRNDDGRRHQRVAGHEREPAIILHTSGSTALPKPVGQSLHSLNARARNQLSRLPLYPEDVVCIFADCSHGFGLHASATPAFAVGATVLLMPEFDPALIIRAMADHGATVTGGAPGYLRGLLDAMRERPHASRLRLAITSTDKAQETLHNEWRETFHAPLVEAYGMTELCSLVMSNRPDDNGVGTVGRPFPGVNIRIAGPDGRDVPDGTTGELLVNGDMLFTGYWNDPDATRQVMVEGWLKTGDQATRDHDGRYRIEGRTGFMIKRGGIFVSPYEVEAALLKHVGVADCMAIGVPSDRWGQEVEALVVLKQATTAAELHNHATDALGEPSRPVRFWSVDAVPKTPLGKVARNEFTRLRSSAVLLS